MIMITWAMVNEHLQVSRTELASELKMHRVHLRDPTLAPGDSCDWAVLVVSIAGSPPASALECQDQMENSYYTKSAPTLSQRATAAPACMWHVGRGCKSASRAKVLRCLFQLPQSSRLQICAAEFELGDLKGEHLTAGTWKHIPHHELDGHGAFL
jgi:hypothetical protein